MMKFIEKHFTLVMASVVSAALASFVLAILLSLGLLNNYTSYTDSVSVIISKGGSGSAIYLGNNYYITNEHVVSKGELTLKSKDKLSAATVVKADKDLDLAIVKTIFTPRDNPVRFCLIKASIGEDVVVVGNPYSLEDTVTKGIISYPYRMKTSWKTPHHQTDAMINPGNSGGAMFRVSTGCVIGMPTFLLKGLGGSINFAIPAETIKKFIKEANIDV